MPLFVLIHSPLVGPGTWSAVAEELAGHGCDVAVPSLLGIAEDGPPYWPLVVTAVAGAATRGEPAQDTAGLHQAARPGPGQPVVLVAHSNAGLFVPAIRRALAAKPACSLFVDATLPSAHGATPTAGKSFLAFLHGLAGPDGRLPQWTDWWGEDEVAPLFPDRRTRELVSREQPRLPLAYFTEEVPVPPGWDDHPCAYLQFSAAYDTEARQAAQRGWQVRALPGQHLHQLADPPAVARALLDMVGSTG
jgi:hypothetical protein